MIFCQWRRVNFLPVSAPIRRSSSPSSVAERPVGSPAATLARRLKPDFCAVLPPSTPQPAESGQWSEVGRFPLSPVERPARLDERDLMRRTLGTFRLGAQFCRLGPPGRAILPHLRFHRSPKLNAVPFHSLLAPAASAWEQDSSTSRTTRLRPRWRPGRAASHPPLQPSGRLFLIVVLLRLSLSCRACCARI